MTRIPGDVDGDGRVTEADALYVARHTILGGEAYPLDPSVADVDGDGVVTIRDAEIISAMSKETPPATTSIMMIGAVGVAILYILMR